MSIIKYVNKAPYDSAENESQNSVTIVKMNFPEAR